MKYTVLYRMASTKIRLAAIMLKITLIALLVVNTTAFSGQRQKTYDELLSQGLVLNHTITPIGQRFYKDFMAHWAAPGEIKDYTIVITERFNPQWGSIVWITVDDDTIYQRSLSARHIQMEDLVRQAVHTVEQYLYRREILKKLQISNDLKGDGL